MSDDDVRMGACIGAGDVGNGQFVFGCVLRCFRWCVFRIAVVMLGLNYDFCDCLDLVAGADVLLLWRSAD